MPAQQLHLHREYRDYPIGGARAHAACRLYLKVQLVHPRTGVENPQVFRGILDTGAERSVVPALGVEYFAKHSPTGLVASTPGRLILADGTPRDNVPSFEVALRFAGLDSTDGDGHVPVSLTTQGRRADGSWRGFPCYAVDFERPVRAAHGDPRRFDQVIIGMDLMRSWHVDLDGRCGRYCITIDADAM